MPKKLPKWKREFNARMRSQLREFAKAKDKRLTQWEYTNGIVTRRNTGWGRRAKLIIGWRPNRLLYTQPRV